MRRWPAAFVLVACAPLGAPRAVLAADGPVIVKPSTGGLVATFSESSPSTSTPSEAHFTTVPTSSEAEVSSVPAESAVILPADIGTEIFDQFCSGANWSPICDPQPAAPTLPQPIAAAAPVAAVAAPAEVTPGMVAEAFRRVDLPASQLVVQPPNGRTLVNFATNFYTEQGSFTRVVTLLGQRVELRIHPDRFGWRFGDGHESWTTTPGAAYPDLQVTHDYQRKGVVHPSVDTAYAATFSVNGGAWQPVDGTVTIPGPPVDLEVVTATPRLVGAD